MSMWTSPYGGPGFKAARLRGAGGRFISSRPGIGKKFLGGLAKGAQFGGMLIPGVGGIAASVAGGLLQSKLGGAPGPGGGALPPEAKGLGLGLHRKRGRGFSARDVRQTKRMLKMMKQLLHLVPKGRSSGGYRRHCA